MDWPYQLTGSYYAVLWCPPRKVTCIWSLEKSIGKISKLLDIETHREPRGKGYYNNKNHGQSAKVKERGKKKEENNITENIR